MQAVAPDRILKVKGIEHPLVDLDIIVPKVAMDHTQISRIQCLVGCDMVS